MIVVRIVAIVMDRWGANVVGIIMLQIVLRLLLRLMRMLMLWRMIAVVRIIFPFGQVRLAVPIKRWCRSIGLVIVLRNKTVALSIWTERDWTSVLC